MIVHGDDCVFRLLGPVQVIGPDRPIVFARRQQLDLLAFLLLNADRVVTVSQIIDAMWGEAVPHTAAMQIKNMLSAVRGALAAPRGALATVERQPAGYKLSIVSGRLDLAVFQSFAAQGKQAKDPHAAAGLYRCALDLWQGASALAGVRAPFAGPARTHLDEQRETVREAFFAAELLAGHHTAIVAELTDAVTTNPSREALVAQLMTALYRSGRSTDALAVFRKARQVLADDYGLEPGGALRQLETLILRGDPSLSGANAKARAPAATPVEPPPRTAPRPSMLPVPAQLPLNVRGFTGRESELAHLRQLIASAQGDQSPPTAICALMGTAGVGKTALAVHWAHQVASGYPDGQLYLNLRGFDPGGTAMSTAEAIRALLDAFEVPPERIPAGLQAQTALYRSLIAGRKMLVLLDNALDTEQVRPLLPGTPGCLAIITSRHRLIGLIAAEGAHPLTLDVLSEEESLEFLSGRLGPQRVSAQREAAERIARQCAGLPLALSLVAARAAIHPGFTLAGLSDELAEAGSGLGALATGDSTVDVRNVFSWSYRRLGDDAALLFRLLGLHPGPDIAAPAAASLVGCAPGRVAALLSDLCSAHLLAEQVPGRYLMHDLLRAYAAERSLTDDTAAQRAAARRRMLDHYLHSAYAAALLVYPHRYQIVLEKAQPSVTLAELAGKKQALQWFSAEHPVLLAVVERAAQEGLATPAWQLASALATFQDRRGHWEDWAATQRTAVAVSRRMGDSVGEAHAQGSLGLACNRLGRHDQAHSHLRRAYELLRELGDPVGQAYTHLRMSHVCEGQSDNANALRHAQSALELYTEAGHGAGQAQAMNSIGWYLAQLGRFSEAIVQCEQAAALHQELGDRQGRAHTLDSLGFAHHHMGDHARAADYYQQALEELRETGDHYYEAITLTHLGETQLAAGDAARARLAWQEALRILDGLGHADAEGVHAKLQQLA
ncbi:SARP family transcriptional regulator [Rhizocola hellebori]|uniref:SARP family transcriptional regulator n=1 Tax=Rhizocola hellebori TaxID=1392758 RepID=A0A8J3QI87_9ACTN|nr:BTAD domain-containing putative transcriptional regulator [Rhizocola hellebori]GIH10517.1 SARP family transcriptional regulator [Rhizocola hellebori]